jgi:subtilase family serine protease
MRKSLYAAFVILACAAFVSAQVPGRIEIPQSSIARPQDAGIRSHTNVMIFLPEGIVYPLNSPGPTSETPASLACVYQLVAQVTGCPISGTTTNPSGGSKAIAIVDAYDYPNAASDLATYSAQFGLPTANFQVVYASGTKPPVDSTGGWELEEALDIEMAHAMAPNAKIFLVEAKSNSNTDLYNAELVASSMVASAGGGEISNSWSGSETSGETSNDSKYFNTSKVVYFASTGDAAFSLGYPATSPNVVAAGGTSIKRTNGLFTSEQYWDNSSGGGGGGISRYEKIPSYQSVIASIVGSKRGVPDISLDADPVSGPAVYDSYPYEGKVYNWLQLGGTSASSPALAGIVNAAGTFSTTTNAELTMIYNEYANPTLYSQEFRDITKGNSKCKTGWDICTGVGVPLTYTGK